VQLRYIDLGKLIAEAGGDPWAVNKSLQSARPAQISDLAEAFHNAGQCTTEAGNAFLQARRVEQLRAVGPRARARAGFYRTLADTPQGPETHGRTRQRP
jgi:hypothetical protein